MAKAKILDDKIVITSEVLTDETIERVAMLAPSYLSLVDEEKVLYEVARDEVYNTFNINGAVFKAGKTTANISEDIMALDNEAKEKRIKNLLTAILIRINTVEEQVTDYLADIEDVDIDIEYLD